MSDIQTRNIQFSSSTLETMKEHFVTEEACDPWLADQDELERLDWLSGGYCGKGMNSYKLKSCHLVET